MTRLRASLLAVLAVPALTGCGQDKVFEVEEFVAEANRNGAGLELGEPLISPDPARDVYGVELAESDRGEGGRSQDAREEGDEHGAEDGAHEHLGGSLTVTPDADAGRAEFERCESAVSLLCYRAANVVVAFENSLPVDLQDRLKAAIVAMESK